MAEFPTHRNRELFLSNRELNRAIREFICLISESHAGPASYAEPGIAARHRDKGRKYGELGTHERSGHLAASRAFLQRPTRDIRAMGGQHSMPSRLFPDLLCSHRQSAVNILRWSAERFVGLGTTGRASPRQLHHSGIPRPATGLSLAADSL